MGTVTYPDQAVEKELNERFVAAKLESAKAPELARKLNVRWLPGLVVCDADERPGNVQIGFLPPDDFIAELDFGRAIILMGEKRYEEAHALFKKVAEGGTEKAPEAWYWWGISRYRQTKDPKDYQKAWSNIVEKWPKSQWARKVGYVLQYET